MKNYILILAAAIAFAPMVSAQITEKERLRQEVEEKQKAMRDGKVVRSNRRVTVRLKNGSRLRGVIKDGKFIEQVDGVSFVPLEVRRPGAGLRLWYYDRTTSYIFLPYKSIAKSTIGEELTDEEVDLIGKRMAEERLAAQLRIKAEMQARKDAAEGKKPTGETGPAKAQAAVPVLTAEQSKLLDEFPPATGWGIDKVNELERQKITLGVYPNKKEQRFLDVFKTWNEAYQIYKKIEDAKSAAKPEANPDPAVPPPGGKAKPSAPPMPGKRGG